MNVLRIKELLKEKGVTGKDLVGKIGITETSLSRIIKGEQQPRFELLMDIAKELDVDIRDLFNTTKDNGKDSKELFIFKEGKYVSIGELDLSKYF
ncbi:hypothetical protein BWZ22_09735 [Seonamhaeicola sp. S2-3]|uniref:helix-turn-helix domain-containing protein n=1 Tax=Seonamhaeicola sp. S2-3 TaxID=1936081 RepID=UPI000972CAC4|nr:helix-turn-helix transcriptional regulator [Seonamhaeicola sp. S2-3]APY11507.1 hypothetical protein BWZ22_09735 [Seonamhaeicola sp. S2-3]